MNILHGKSPETSDRTHEDTHSAFTAGWEPDKGIRFSDRAGGYCWLASSLVPGHSASHYGHADEVDAAHDDSRGDERHTGLSLDTAKLAPGSAPYDELYPVSPAEQKTHTLDAPAP